MLGHGLERLSTVTSASGICRFLCIEINLSVTSNEGKRALARLGDKNGGGTPDYGG